jgi:hypothetical protein
MSHRRHSDHHWGGMMLCFFNTIAHVVAQKFSSTLDSTVMTCPHALALGVLEGCLS